MWNLNHVLDIQFFGHVIGQDIYFATSITCMLFVSTFCLIHYSGEPWQAGSMLHPTCHPHQQLGSQVEQDLMWMHQQVCWHLWIIHSGTDI
jgi:hypothetical protein